MVRYEEYKNLNESVDVEEIRALLEKHFRFVDINDFSIDPNTGIVDNLIPKSRIYLTSAVNNKIPIKFGKIRSHFHCSGMGLDSLENAPDEVGGNFFCTKNNLTSFEHVPKRLIKATIGNGSLYGNINPLESLKGIEMDNIVYNIDITYDPGLPLLRLLVAKNAVTFVPAPGKAQQPEIKYIQDIFNEHIKKYPNLKERIFKCQYALIKAGFKANAKW